ncbi:hypothetical protein J6590_011118 [Homalodisca vitripennis]|nr:hypothetical protein J6590_011118 [Homalodisca vitripennis]
MAALPKEAIAQLKVFIHLVKTNPELLHTPDLKFFKDFLESYGGKVPEVSSQSQSQSQSSPSKKPTPAPEPKPPTPEPESEESDIELDNSGVIDETLLAHPLSISQHAYVEGKSSTTALHSLVEVVENTFNEKEALVSVFMDIEEAFN